MPSMSLADIALVVLYAAIVMIPGLAMGLVGGLRGWAAVAAAPLLGYGVCAVVGPLGVPWHPWSFGVGAVVLGAVSGGLWLLQARLGRRRGPADDPAPRAARDVVGELTVAAGVLSGAAIGFAVVLLGFDRLDAVHQDWDATFHANAIRFIADTGDADPVALRALNNYEAPSFFYPNSYHALAAVVGDLSGTGIPNLMNAQMLLLAGMAGLGLAALLRHWGVRVAVAATAPVLLACIMSFAPDVLFRGPLLPFAAGIALVPAFLVLVDTVLRRRNLGVALLTAIAAVGLLGLHPSAALTAALFAVPMFVARWARHPRGIPVDLTVLVVLAVGIAGLGLPFVTGALDASADAGMQDWPAVQNPGQAVGDLLLFNHARPGPQFWLAALLLAGLLVPGRLRAVWWWLVGGIVFVGGFVLAAAYDLNWSETVTGPWWNDSWRFAAIAAMALAVLTAAGAVQVGEQALLWARRRRHRDGPGGRVAVGVAVAVVLGVFGLLSNGFYVPANADRVATAYRDGPTVSQTEQTAMAELARLVGPGQRVMNDPRDGSPWMYALDGVHPMFGHIIAPGAVNSAGPDQQELIRRFNCLDRDPQIRRLVDKYRITYVYVGVGFVRGDFTRLAGLVGLDSVGGLQRVWNGRGGIIYRVEPVGQPGPVGGPPGCDGATPQS